VNEQYIGGLAFPGSGSGVQEGMHSRNAYLQQSVEQELAAEAELQSRLTKQYEDLGRTRWLIAACIDINLIAFIFLPGYFLIWIVASFYMYMFYPLFLMVPTRRSDGQFSPEGGVMGLIARVREASVLEHKVTIGQIFWNTFFLNCRPLFAAWAVVYLLDIVFGLMGIACYQLIECGEAMLIIYQAIAIMLFYAGIWWLKPYSSGFRDTVLGVKKGIGTSRKPIWLIVLLLGGATALLTVLIITAMLLPGFTVGQILSLHEVTSVRIEVAFIIIFITQFFIVRYLHSWESIRMMLRLSENKVEILRSHVIAEMNIPCGHYMDRYRELSMIYLKSTLYQPGYQDLIGYFPVYMGMPDLSRILDSKILRVLNTPLGIDER